MPNEYTGGEQDKYLKKSSKVGAGCTKYTRFSSPDGDSLTQCRRSPNPAQFTERKTEPNSGLGKAITYLTTTLATVDAFSPASRSSIRQQRVERALKRAVLHRKNALFYRTLNGADVGDLFMNLIHTCQLCNANSFDYLTELQRHAHELATKPAEWMPWTYRETLERTVSPSDSA